MVITYDVCDRNGNGDGMSDKATFLASIPPIQSALRTGGDGMRIQLDVPETEIGESIKLVLMRGKILRVTIETLEDSKAKQERKI